MYAGEEKGASLVAAELARHGAKKVGIVVPLSAAAWKCIEQRVTLVSLGEDFIRLRMIKSEEEIAWCASAAHSAIGACAR